jgi:hypothetical protein
MVDGIHGDTAVVGATTEPTAATGFSKVHIGVLTIANLSDGCPAFKMNSAHFTRRQAELPPIAFLS